MTKPRGCTCRNVVSIKTKMYMLFQIEKHIIMTIPPFQHSAKNTRITWKIQSVHQANRCEYECVHPNSKAYDNDNSSFKKSRQKFNKKMSSILIFLNFFCQCFISEFINHFLFVFCYCCLNLTFHNVFIVKRYCLQNQNCMQ